MLADLFAFPTKTGADWMIPIREPLQELFHRQRQVSYVGRTDGWIFPNARGGHLHYANWLRRGWEVARKRANLVRQPGDAQKALRRTFISSALICGRNPKEVAEEVGHSTPRMVLDVYDSFLGADAWPSHEERNQLAIFFGFTLPPQPPPRQEMAANSSSWKPSDAPGRVPILTENPPPTGADKPLEAQALPPAGPPK